VPLATRAVQAAPRVPWYFHALALADYRAGQIERAIRWDQESMAADPHWTHPLNWLLLALAHSRLSHGAEARRWLEQAVQLMDSQPLQNDWHLHEWLAWQLLRSEAESLVK
jgi:Flp pilus assembly protein TadD